MAARKTHDELKDNLVIEQEQRDDEYKGPRVPVFLPKLEEEGGGVKVDQYEHVTIANEEKETLYRVKRGVTTDVPVPVFIVLKEKYPDL